MDIKRAFTPFIVGVALVALAFSVAPRFSPTPPQPVATAQTPMPTKGITVAGTGRASIKPDMALVRLGVRTQAETAQQAQQGNAQNMDSVVRTLKGLGISDKDIQTSTVSLRPIYNRDRTGSQETIVGYEASNTVNVRVIDLSKVGSVLDEAVKSGANTAGGIQFGVQNDTEERKEALEKAVRDAQGKAEAIAKAMGRSLGGAESVIEESVYSPRPEFGLRAMEDLATAPAQTPIEPGELEVTASVRIVYGF